MPNWCENLFELTGLKPDEVDAVQTAIDEERDPFEALFRLRQVPPLQFRWDGHTGAMQVEEDGTFHGHMLTGWSMPRDLVEMLRAWEMVTYWKWFEEAASSLGYVKGDTWYDSPDPMDPNEYEDIFDHQHPWYEGGTRCLAKPGDMICDEESLFGVCASPGYILPFGGEPIRLGRVSKRYGWWIPTEDEYDVPNIRRRQPGTAYAKNLVRHEEMMDED